jgi:hypothetical protein
MNCVVWQWWDIFNTGSLLRMGGHRAPTVAGLISAMNAANLSLHDGQSVTMAGFTANSFHHCPSFFSK